MGGTLLKQGRKHRCHGGKALVKRSENSAYMEVKTLLEWEKALKKTNKQTQNKYVLTRIKNSARLELKVFA